MPTYQEIQELLVKVQGRDDLADLVKKYQAAEQAKADLDRRLADDPFRAFSLDLKAATSELDRLGKELAKSADITNEARSKINGLNMAVRNLGYGLSDVFANNGPIGAKLIGFGNNVGNLVTGVMQSMGKLTPQTAMIAAGMEIAFNATGAAMNAFGIKTVEDLKDLFTGAEKVTQDELKKIEGHIKGLTDKPYLINIELHELDLAQKKADDLKATLQEIKRLQTSQTEEQQKSGQDVAKAIGEATNNRGEKVGAPGFERAIAAPILAELNRQTGATSANEQAEIRKKIADAKKRADSSILLGHDEAAAAALAESAAAEEELEAAKKRLADAKELNKKKADQKAANLILSAVKGNEDALASPGGTRQSVAQEELARRAAEAGFKPVAADIVGASPEKVAEAKQNEERTRLAEAQREAEKDRARLAEQLQVQGQANHEADERKKEADERKVEAEKRAAETKRQQDEHEAKRQADAEEKDRARLVDQYSKSTDIDEQASAMAARLKAAGGDEDRFGRFHEMNPQQQREAVEAAVFEALQKRFGAVNAAGAAPGIAGQATDKVNQQVAEWQAQLVQGGLDTVDAAQMALREIAKTQMAQAADAARIQQGLASAVEMTRQARRLAGKRGN